MTLHSILPKRWRLPYGARGSTALLATLLCAATALAGSDGPENPGPGDGPGSSGGAGGNYSAGDETVGTLPSVLGNPFDPGWLLPGDHLVLEGSVSAVHGVLRLARGHGVVRVEVLDDAGTRLRATFAGDWRIAIRAMDLTVGELTVGVEVVEDGTLAVLGMRDRARNTMVLGAGDLALPLAGLAGRGSLDSAPFALHTRNSLGIVTRLLARERQGLVTLDLRTF